jgi:hypothetical protein
MCSENTQMLNVVNMDSRLMHKKGLGSLKAKNGMESLIVL